jgi:hypothetical protein
MLNHSMIVPANMFLEKGTAYNISDTSKYNLGISERAETGYKSQLYNVWLLYSASFQFNV